MAKSRFSSAAKCLDSLLVSVVCLALVIAAEGITWSADRSVAGEVGEFGLPSRLQVTGLRTITNDRLRKALAEDGPIGWASLPLASLDEYLQLVKTRAVLGLQRDGFREPLVEVFADQATGNVVVRVEEGPRFLAGDLRIMGGSQEVREHLTQWLTSAQPPAEATPEFTDSPQGPVVHRWVAKDGSEADLVEPLWKKGQAVPWDSVAHEQIANDARRAISEIRGDDARLQVAVVPSARPDTADLVIEIFDEGRPAMIREIVVHGGERDSRDDVLAYLGLAEGQTATPSSRLRWEQKLRLSGRYRRQAVQMQRLVGRDEVVVQIDLVEYPPASPIASPLTRAEQTMLKCREWLMRMGERGDDHRFVLSDTIGDRRNVCELILAPDRGIWASFQSTKGAAPSGEAGTGAEASGSPRPADSRPTPLSAEVIAVSLTNERLAIHLPTVAKKLEVPLATSAQLVLSLGTTLAEPANGKAAYDLEEKPFQLKLGAGVKSGDAGERAAPVAMEFVFTPVSFIAQLYEDNARVEWEGEILKLSTPAQVVRVDSRTGRLVEMIFQSDGDKTGGWTIVQGGLARQLAEFAAAPMENLYDPSRPVSSSLSFLSEVLRVWKQPVLELVAASEKQGAVVAPAGEPSHGDRSQLELWTDVARVLEIATRIAADGQLQDVDEAVVAWATQPTNRDEKDLVIPWKANGEANHMLRSLAGFSLRGLDVVLERDTWPSMAGRTLACMVCGELKLVGPEMQRLFWKSDIGPVGCLLLSHWIPDPRAHLAFARRGLDMLSLDDFRRERAALLAPLERFGLLRRAVSTLRRLQPEEARDLGRILLHDERGLVTIVSQLRAAPDDSAALKSLPDTLDSLWINQLSDSVRIKLSEQVRRVAAQSEPSAQ